MTSVAKIRTENHCRTQANSPKKKDGAGPFGDVHFENQGRITMTTFFIVVVAMIGSVPASRWVFDTLMGTANDAAYRAAFADIVDKYYEDTTH